MLTAFLLILLLIGIGFVIYLLLSSKHAAQDNTMLEWLKTTQRDLRNLERVLSDSQSRSSREISDTLRSQTRDIHDRLTQAQETIGELKREAGAFAEVGRSMKDLQDFLKSPKLRGNLGEQVLNDLIGQLFPKGSFFLQHRFKTGSIVDVALKTEAGILPIDSKFPMEQFEVMMKGETKEKRESAKREFVRDVKKHIDAISGKYILPEEGTMDFALMYLPSESVYYEVASEPSLLEYARARRVYPVSPTTLYAHLQTILLSFEGKKVEEKSKLVFAHLRAIEKDFSKLSTNFGILGKHITSAHKAYTTSSSSLSALERSVTSARSLGTSGKKQISGIIDESS